MLGLLVDIAFDAMLPLSLKFIIDDAIVPRRFDVLAKILFALVTGGILVALSQVGRDYLYAYLAAHVLDDLRRKLYSHLQGLSLGFYARVRTTEIMARFSTDLAAVENAIVMALPAAMMATLGLIVSATILIVLQWRLALVAVLGVPLCVIVPRLVSPHALRAGYVMKGKQSRLSAMIQEHIAAQPVIKAFGLVPVFAPGFTQTAAALRESAKRANFLAYFMERAPNIGVLTFNIALIAVGAYLTINGRLSIGALVSFQALFMNLSQAVYGITWALPHLVQASSGMQRIDELLTERAQVSDSADAMTMQPLREGVSFTGVSFAYESQVDTRRTARRDQPTSVAELSELTLDIPAGSFVALVGPSGSGKSTVIKLLMRFYDPQIGAVSVDGQNICDVTQESLRAQIGVVFQDSFLFDTSVGENIRLGKPGATDAEVGRAARLAEIHETINAMPEGYRTGVGERGERLSGGERQRVAIARALIRSPSVLVLDEATSALDPGAEAAINATIERLRAGRTVITVTHRLSAVTGASRIFAMQHGQLAEWGTHGELLARNGVYRSMWDKQSGVSVSADGDRAWIDASYLRRLPLLRDVDEALLTELAGLFGTEHYAEGREVIVQGDPGDRFYLVARGRLEVFNVDATGSSNLVATLGDGDYFGEVALLHNVPRTATVCTVTPSVLLSLSRGQFSRLLDRSPEVRERLIARLTERNAAARTI